MQSFRHAIPPTIFETFPRAARTASLSLQSTQPTQQPVRQFQSAPRRMLDSQSYKIQSSTPPTAPGVNLSEPQKVTTASILDLFAGVASPRKPSLWDDDATFADPLTIVEDPKQYAAQWYGLPAAFSNMERLDGHVVSGWNRTELKLKPMKERVFRDFMRNLKSVAVPTLVKVPKSIEEEEEKKNQ